MVFTSQVFRISLDLLRIFELGFFVSSKNRDKRKGNTGYVKYSAESAGSVEIADKYKKRRVFWIYLTVEGRNGLHSNKKKRGKTIR